MSFIDQKKYDSIIKGIQILPSIGQKTAERIFDSLIIDNSKINQLLTTLDDLKKDFKQCLECYCLSINNRCIICKDLDRDRTKICIVANIRDFMVINEKNTDYKGLFHVLNGEINVKNGQIPDKLTINQLVSRLKSNPEIQEVIFALNLTFDGEVTLTYLKKIFNDNKITIKLSRIAQGIPFGSSLEYVDESTLKQALCNRNIVE